MFACVANGFFNQNYKLGNKSRVGSSGIFSQRDKDVDVLSEGGGTAHNCGYN